MHENNYTSKKILSFKNIVYAINKHLSLILIILVIFLFFVYANNYRLNLEYKPYNGSFQTFNPLRRVFLGHLPGRDFNPYLGLLTTYITAFTTFVFGGDFAASRFSINFISLIFHLISLIILFYLSGFTVKQSIIASSAITIAFSFDLKQLTPFWELAGPGNSNLSIRSALPFLTSLALILLFKYRNNTKLFYCTSGLLIGIQPLWSNDYGIPSCLTLSAIIILDLIKQERSKKIFKAILLLVYAFIALSVSAYVLTVGNLTKWVVDNFNGVASDQFWYFVWYNGHNKIFSITDILSHPFFYFYIPAIIILLIHTLTQHFTVKYLILLYISITVFGAGLLSSIGGTISTHYYYPSIFVSLFVFPLAIRIVWTTFIIENKFEQKSKFTDHKQHFILVALLIFYLAALATNTIAYQLFLAVPSEKNGFFWIEELGGWLPSQWKPSIQIARKIKQELKAELPTKRILSTYSSGMDVVAGAINPTGIDYIIHALGNHARTHYLEQFKKSQPKYITTLREDFSKWETWARRTNWWFYREFIDNYQPIAATFYNIIWQRQPHKAQNYPPALCRIIQENNNTVNLNITTEKQQDNQIFYVEIGLNYHLEVEHSGIPVIGGRGLVNATEKQTALNLPIGKNSNHSYGMPPSHNSWYIPIEHQLGTLSILEIKGYPAKRSKLIVESCKARLITPVDSFAVTRSLTSANLTDTNSKNGILISSTNNPNLSHPGFIINNQEVLSELYPGMNVEFFTSGKRKIINIQDNKVWVTGTILDPIADGYPHPIIVTMR